MVDEKMAAEGGIETHLEGVSDVASDAETSADGAGVESSDAGNRGWADVMTRLLNAPAPKKRYVILSKAKKVVPSPNEEKEEARPDPGPGFEVEGEDVEVVEKKALKSRSAARSRVARRREEVEKRKKHREWESLGRKKPDITEKDRERMLCKIATRGVVQLFNAVRKQQQEVQGQLKEAGGSLRKTEQALKAVSKEAFLERLRDGEPAPSAQTEPDEGATWSVLRDDYLPEAGLKDWDRDTDMEEDSGSAGESEDSA